LVAGHSSTFALRHNRPIIRRLLLPFMNTTLTQPASTWQTVRVDVTKPPIYPYNSRANSFVSSTLFTIGADSYFAHVSVANAGAATRVPASEADRYFQQWPRRVKTKLIEEAAGCSERRGQRGLGWPIDYYGRREGLDNRVGEWVDRTGLYAWLRDSLLRAAAAAADRVNYIHSTRFHKERKNTQYTVTTGPRRTISAQLRYLNTQRGSCRHTPSTFASPVPQFQDVAVPVFLICGIHVQAFRLPSSQRLSKSHTHMRLSVLLL